MKLKTDLIDIDKEQLCYTSIDRDNWLKKVLGDPIENEALDLLLDGDTWLNDSEDQIITVLNKIEGDKYEAATLSNTCNNENDFDSEFIYQVFTPVVSEDHLYSRKTYVAIEPHLGGDPRGNYGRAVVYGPIDSLAETGFFDWRVSWNVSDLDGNYLEESQQFTCGYSNSPTTELAKHFVNRHGWEVVTKYSEKKNGYLARHVSGVTRVLYPYCEAENI